MKKIVIFLVMLLLIGLRQDVWNWDNTKLFFDFLPLGLLYQMFISLGATFLWILVCLYAWPTELDD